MSDASLCNELSLLEALDRLLLSSSFERPSKSLEDVGLEAKDLLKLSDTVATLVAGDDVVAVSFHATADALRLLVACSYESEQVASRVNTLLSYLRRFSTRLSKDERRALVQEMGFYVYEQNAQRFVKTLRRGDFWVQQYDTLTFYWGHDRPSESFMSSLKIVFQHLQSFDGRYGSIPVAKLREVGKLARDVIDCPDVRLLEKEDPQIYKFVLKTGRYSDGVRTLYRLAKSRQKALFLSGFKS